MLVAALIGQPVSADTLVLGDRLVFGRLVLGHAFGLAGHRDLVGTPSIMDSVIQPGLTRPTREDALALAQVLLAAISGAAAGRLDADGPGVEVAPSAKN